LIEYILLLFQMKRNGKKVEPVVIEYNEDSQKDFVTGFRKRKIEKKRKTVLKYKLKHVEEKREARLPKQVPSLLSILIL